MPKSTIVDAKTRARPVRQDPVSAVRLPSDLTDKIDAWSEMHGAESRSDAIHRLVELGLKA